MVDVKQIKVSSKFTTSFLYIEFTIEDTHFNLDNYIFDLYKSNNPTSGFLLIASDIKTFSYIDTFVNLYNISIDYYYKIKVTEKLTGKSKFSDIEIYNGQQPDMEAEALVSTYKTYLENVIKNNIILLKRKHTGQICTCFDDIRKRANPVHCDICYGTKYVGGYYDPIKIFVSFLNSPGRMESFDLSNVSEDIEEVSFWTLNFPKIRVNDILIDQNNLRYIVERTQETHKNLYPLKQTITMKHINESNVAYNIPDIRW